uniref:B-cell receptor CD22 n=1 Tax=Naja naja TaxID=35670 RepID=A0A8C6Y7F8_NAJNA
MHSDLVSLEGGKKEVTVTDVLSLETQVFWLSQRKDYNEELVLRKQLTFQNLNLTRLKLTMRCFLWMLFLPGYCCKGSLDKPLSVTPKTLSAWEGSCVFISCNIKEEFHDRRINQWSFVWYFQPSFDKSLNDYSGTLLYSSNQTATEVSSEFSNRVQFVGDLGSKNCSLKISQLHLSDNGSYGIRLYWIPGELKTSDKWFEILEVIVHKTPSELIKTVSPEMIEGNNYTVACSIPYYCYDELIKLSIQGLEDHHVSPPKMTTEIQTVQTTFMATWKDHGKQLTCLLKTHDGREMKKSFANLTVKYVPKGVKVNAEPGGTVREGNKLTLECIVNSSNPPVFSYWWYKNGESWNTKQWGSRRDFYSLKGTDSGSYRCEVNNGIGRVDSDNLTINVQYPPKVNIIKSQSLIQEKDSVVLTCSATGNPPIDGYKWYKSSTPGFIVDRQELRIGAIQPNDSDTYHCVAHNKIGSSNASVTLNVHYCPKDVQLFLLNHLPIKEGDKVILNCSVGSSYPSNNNYKFFGASGDLLRSWGSTLIVFAIPAPITSYKCEACNSVGCTFSPTITLDVLCGPKDVKLNRKPSGLVLEGNPVHLICSVRMANPNQLSYTWYKNGQLLPLNSAENVLFIQNASSMDSGIYHCISKNSITKAESPTIRLEVNYGPRNVHLTLDKKAVTEGMDLYLRCDNDAYPPVATYKWYWKGEEIFMENSKILILRKIKVEHSGEYFCRAFNTISNKESQFITISVSFNRATVMKHILIGLGVVLAFIIFLGLLLYGLKKWKKTIRSNIDSTQRPARGSFFVRKAKREVLPNNNSRLDEHRRDCPLDWQHEEQDGTISYARLQFPHSGLNDRTIYSSVTQPNMGLDSSENSVIYSVVKKPAFHPKNDTKRDYENVVKKEEEEELHYSSLVNLAPRSHPTKADLETDSESEDSIQYAALKH